MKTKYCKSCERVLTVDHFSKQTNSNDGYMSICKYCLRVYRELKKRQKYVSVKDILAYNKNLKNDFTNSPLNVYYENNGNEITLIYPNGIKVAFDKYEMSKLLKIKARKKHVC